MTDFSSIVKRFGVIYFRFEQKIDIQCRIRCLKIALQTLIPRFKFVAKVFIFSVVKGIFILNT
ncbi:MAG: hypothetical protein DBX40_06215 [Clostridiales bacterium]|nr:MAG: hypothetical protein DBX40_06215 [Clostridiales bacterium]